MHDADASVASTERDAVARDVPRDREAAKSLQHVTRRHLAPQLVPLATPPRWHDLGGATLLTMTDAARKLLDAAMRLAPSERAKLAAQLLATLDDAEPDVGWEQAWVTELSRRVDEGSETESWEAVYTRLRARR